MPSRPLVPIQPDQESLIANRHIDYLYRGYVIRIEDRGYSVYDPRAFDDPDEVAWGRTSRDVMAAVNEIVDGDTRRLH